MGEAFTDFTSVTRSTKLEELNLNWRERELPEYLRTKHVHRLHPYLGKFIPQLAEIFLRKYFKPRQTVLDPFCGSGTTLVQASELGMDSIGYDISAFNVLLSKVKTATYNLERLEHEVADVLEKTRLATQSGAHQLRLGSKGHTNLAAFTASAVSNVDSRYLEEWYAPQALLELIAYRHFLESGTYRYLDVMRVILSRAARSARLTTHFELDFPKRPTTTTYACHKHSRICSPTEKAFKFLERYSLNTVQRIREFAALRTPATVEVRHADSRRARTPTTHGMFTSPPYVGLIDYHAQHEYAYHLLGLQDKRHLEIGAAASGASASAKETYKDAIATVLRRATASMPSGAPIIVVAGDRHNLYPDIALAAGLEQETVIERHVNRRTGRRSTDFFESVFVWRKP